MVGAHPRVLRQRQSSGLTEEIFVVAQLPRAQQLIQQEIEMQDQNESDDSDGSFWEENWGPSAHDSADFSDGNL